MSEQKSKDSSYGMNRQECRAMKFKRRASRVKDGDL